MAADARTAATVVVECATDGLQANADVAIVGTLGCVMGCVGGARVVVMR